MTINQNHQSELFLNAHKNRARLLISCPDRPGIVAAVTQFLFMHGANIVQSNQYSTDPEGGRFFMRVEFEITDLPNRANVLEQDFADASKKFEMDWRISYVGKLKRMGIFVSKQDHCLLELLWQWQSGELNVDIPLVISNHPDLQSTVERFGIQYHCVPVTKDNKAQAEQKQMELLADKIDFCVLARYMQVLSQDFVKVYHHRIINIHHSFLPAFMGGRPYERAYERGVKLIGATSHYVTEDLDEGPIIEQDVTRVNHSYHVDDLKQEGRHIERVVLARAIRWHVEDRIILDGNKTVIFNR